MAWPCCTDGGSLPVDDVGCADEDLPEGMQFPMWVLPMQEFLRVSGTPPQHETLVERGLLVRHRPGSLHAFYSHQWLSPKHADPEGKQLRVVQQVLNDVIRGKISVGSDAVTVTRDRLYDRLSDDTVRALPQARIWMDWFSIPQIKSRVHDGHDASRQFEDDGEAPPMQRAVNSIAAYVAACDLFLMVCPPLPHDAGGLCDFESYNRRGWCRMELLARLHSRRADRKVIVVKARNDVFLRSTHELWALRPAEGDFTVEADRTAVGIITARMVSATRRSLQDRGLTDTVRYRLLTALARGHSQSLRMLRPETSADIEGFLRSNRVTRRTTVRGRERALSEDSSQVDIEFFLSRYYFESIDDPCDQGFGPLFCAAVEGNEETVLDLVGRRCDPNARLTGSDDAVQQGWTPMLAAIAFDCTSDVVEALLDVGANIGRSALGICAAYDKPDFIELLLQRRAAIHSMIETLPGLRAQPIHVAAMSGHLACCEMLLSYGASANSRTSLGFTTLSMCGAHGSAEVAELLVNARAEVNHRNAWPSTALSACVVSGCRVLSCLGFVGAANIVAESPGATPLIMAAAMGQVELCRRLLALRAAPAAKNSLGRDFVAAAERAGHGKTIMELLLKSGTEAEWTLVTEV